MPERWSNIFPKIYPGDVFEKCLLLEINTNWFVSDSFRSCNWWLQSHNKLENQEYSAFINSSRVTFIPLGHPIRSTTSFLCDYGAPRSNATKDLGSIHSAFELLGEWALKNGDSGLQAIVPFFLKNFSGWIMLLINGFARFGSISSYLILSAPLAQWFSELRGRICKQFEIEYISSHVPSPI